MPTILFLLALSAAQDIVGQLLVRSYVLLHCYYFQRMGLELLEETH